MIKLSSYKIHPAYKIFTAALTGCFFVWGCVNDETKVKGLFEKKLGIDSAKQVESYMSRDGKMKAKLVSPLMVRYQDTLPRVEFPNTLHVDFFDDSLKVESQLNARFARYFETQNKVFLKDSVVVFNTLGDTLHCVELWWDQQAAEFTTDKPVRIYRKDMIMIGVGLKAPQDFKTFEMYNIQPSVIRVPASQFPG
ncbi:MAG: LPS export ABC transporter periplasmic protein LptC [Chitinophagaceae bacterium]|nr:LPS export ABC transporter periplasmic protein LptC [Chitinophagaceae bacterium]